MTRSYRIATLMLLTLLTCPAGAQEVGTVASLEGSADIGRANAWTPAAIGSAISMGDQVRTGTPGRLSIVFQDDSVVSVADNSQIVVDQQLFNPTGGTVRSLIELLRGKLNAVVGDYYHQPGTAFEVKTVTAVAGVRGTEFSITYDPASDLTEVIGVSGVVQVHSLLDPTGPGVLVRASEVTRIPEGQLPTAPQRMEEMTFRQNIEGIQFIGGGKPESLLAGNSLRSGSAVPPSEHAPSGGAPVPGQSLKQPHDASQLVGDSPVVVKVTTGQLGIHFPH